MKREEAIKLLNDIHSQCCDTANILCTLDADKRYDALQMAITALQNYPVWIPVSERLPNEDEFIKSYRRNKYAAEFIVMIKGANRPTTLYFTHDGWWTDNMKDRYDVTAWMPLPEPYLESEEELADEIYNELTEI